MELHSGCSRTGLWALGSLEGSAGSSGVKIWPWVSPLLRLSRCCLPQARTWLSSVCCVGNAFRHKAHSSSTWRSTQACAAIFAVSATAPSPATRLSSATFAHIQVGWSRGWVGSISGPYLWASPPKIYGVYECRGGCFRLRHSLLEVRRRRASIEHLRAESSSNPPPTPPPVDSLFPIFPHMAQKIIH